MTLNVPEKIPTILCEYCRFYNYNGINYAEFFIVNNRIEGILKKYDCYKNLICEENYIDGKLNGQCIKNYYNEISNIYYVNGLKHGMYKEYFDNGKLKYEINYVNGNIHGMYKEYFDNGELNSEIYYVNGKRHE